MVKPQITEKISRKLKQASACALTARAGEIHLAPFVTLKGVADETLKLLVTDSRGRSIAVIMWSSAVAPDMVSRGAARARAAREALGANLDSVPLMPLLEGTLEDRTFAVMPLMIPLSTKRLIGRVQRWRIAPSILRWLQGATVRTRKELSTEEKTTGFGHPLEYLNSMEAMPAGLRYRTEIALRRLSDGEWSPSTVLMHGDLWIGNIFIDPRRKDRPWHERFVVIDWAGAAVQGYAIYDLIRVALSLRLPQSRFLSELSRQVEILGCDMQDATSYLLAALGHIGSHLEYFPLERFVRMSLTCTNYLEDTIK